MFRASIAFIVGSVGLAAPVFAETARWINGAGGLYTEAGNWDIGRVPVATDDIVFDLPGTYMVSLPSGIQMTRTMKVANGSLVLGGPGRLTFGAGTLQSLQIGEEDAPAALTLLNSQIETNGNEAFLIIEGSTLEVREGGILYTNNVANIYDGAFLRVNGGIFDARKLNLGGTSVITNGGELRGGQLFISSAANVAVSGANSRITAEETAHLGGTMALTEGGRLEAVDGMTPSFTTGQLNLLVSGGGAAHVGGISTDTESLITIENGGIWRGAGTAEYRSPFFVRPGADVQIGGRYFVAPDINQAATVTRLNQLTLDQGLIVEIDGLAMPTTPIVQRNSNELPTTFISGPLTVRMRNANALRIGEVVPIFAHQSSDTQAFSSVVHHPMGGGRVLQLQRTGSPAVTNVVVVQGTPSCYDQDFNGDGDPGTDADIEAFFACLAGSCCDTCATADFNGDGDAGTDADIEAFFLVLAGGSC